jgi:protein-L-isoaspartate(D-aspartate) O-methyltransferase
VLDVGVGSGYLTSVLYRLVNGATPPLQGGTVVGIEHIPALTALAERNIRADGLDGALDQQGIVLLTGDGRLGAPPFPPTYVYASCFCLSDIVKNLGYAEKGPYDVIHVGAAAREVPPALVEQLASPGRMVIPVGTYSQRLMQVDKDARGQITQRDLFGVVVRPLFFFFVCVCARTPVPAPPFAQRSELLAGQYVPLTDRPA